MQLQQRDKISGILTYLGLNAEILSSHTHIQRVALVIKSDLFSQSSSPSDDSFAMMETD